MTPTMGEDFGAGETAADRGGERSLTSGEREALLRACYAEYSTRLFEVLRGSLDLASDLFDTQSGVADGQTADFLSKRGEWIERVEQAIAAGFARRMAGERRRGRRPDSDATASSLAVLTPFDHEKQAALVATVDFLGRFTRREQAALDGRLALLLPAQSGEIDSPFSPAYLLDALGPASRTVYPNPRVWRPLMARVLGDITPSVNKVYISLNRLLADRGVLPELKAALRARSEWRPADDAQLLPTFSRMLAEVGPLPTDIVVPAASPGSAAFALPTSAAETPTGRAAAPSAFAVSPAILAGLAALADRAAHASASASSAAPDGGDYPNLDPLMALGSSTPLFATLGQWQRLDLPAAIVESMIAAKPGAAEATIPLNLVPHIRAAVAEQVGNPSDRIAMDVIALLFDYVFRDPSIPERQRRLFSRLQVPIVKAALIDRSFFADREHPARKLLDHLAEAAIGATADDAYGAAFESTAERIIDDVCSDFDVDVAVFAAADAALLAFVEAQHREAAPALEANVARALASEQDEADRAHVRALVRDRLAGLDVPFDVRSFVETVWADYLAALRRDHGESADSWRAALATLDDLLWSIEVKERSAQKARLTKMIPTLVTGLRRGCRTISVPDERAKPFFDTLYGLHMSAIRAPATLLRPPLARPAATGATPTDSIAAVATAVPRANVHDFVSEMAVGTWLAFGRDAEAVNARLSWVSPLRSKYVFTSRSRTQAFAFSPEELAWELGSGRAALVVEPVPLFDRAVSAALDTLAATRTADKAA
jgi:hypothetical protein